MALREKARAILQPHQLGVGLPGGAKAAAHAARLLLINSGRGIVKLDFCNAFNELDRSALINAVDRLIPEMGLFVRSCYVEPTTRDLDGHTISSQRGVQQDPLGPLLFAIGIEKLSSPPRCKFGVWYLDDGTVGGEAEEVCAEVSRIRECATSLGLALSSKETAGFGTRQ